MNCWPCGDLFALSCCDDPYPFPTQRLIYLTFNVSSVVQASNPCVSSVTLSLQLTGGDDPATAPQNAVVVWRTSDNWTPSNLTYNSAAGGITYFDKAPAQPFVVQGTNRLLTIPPQFIQELINSDGVLSLELELSNGQSANVLSSFSASASTLSVTYSSCGTNFQCSNQTTCACQVGYTLHSGQCLGKPFSHSHKAHKKKEKKKQKQI